MVSKIYVFYRHTDKMSLSTSIQHHYIIRNMPTNRRISGSLSVAGSM